MFNLPCSPVNVLQVCIFTTMKNGVSYFTPPFQDEKLRKLVEQHGMDSWKSIAYHFPVCIWFNLRWVALTAAHGVGRGDRKVSGGPGYDVFCFCVAVFQGRTDGQCQHRWQKVLNPELVKGPWTKEEDQKVRGAGSFLLWTERESMKMVNNSERRERTQFNTSRTSDMSFTLGVIILNTSSAQIWFAFFTFLQTKCFMMSPLIKHDDMRHP